jgi:hypothetical protein
MPLRSLVRLHLPATNRRPYAESFERTAAIHEVPQSELVLFDLRSTIPSYGEPTLFELSRFIVSAQIEIVKFSRLIRALGSGTTKLVAKTTVQRELYPIKQVMMVKGKSLKKPLPRASRGLCDVQGLVRKHYSTFHSAPLSFDHCQTGYGCSLHRAAQSSPGDRSKLRVTSVPPFLGYMTTTGASFTLAWVVLRFR